MIYQTLQEYRAAQARDWMRRNAPALRAAYWARKQAQSRGE